VADIDDGMVSSADIHVVLRQLRAALPVELSALALHIDEVRYIAT
jgi:hypothetical protein